MMPRTRKIPEHQPPSDESPDDWRLICRETPPPEPGATEQGRLLRFANEQCRRHAQCSEAAEFSVCGRAQALRCTILYCRVNDRAHAADYVLKWRPNPGRWNVAHEYESLRHLHQMSRHAETFSVIEPVAYLTSPAALLTVRATGAPAHRHVRRACRRTASAGDRERVRVVLDRAAAWLVELQQLTQESLTADEARASAQAFLDNWLRLFNRAAAAYLPRGAAARLEGLVVELLDHEVQSPRRIGVHGDFGLAQLLECTDGRLRGLDFELYDSALVSTDAGQQRITLEYMAANPWWSPSTLQEVWGGLVQALVRRGVSTQSLLLGYLGALPPRITGAPRQTGKRAARPLRSWRHRRWVHSRRAWLEQLAQRPDPDAAGEFFAKEL